MITLTDNAKNKIKEIAASEGLEDQFVRIKIKGGGCQGFMHDMDFTLVKRDTDETLDFDGIQVVIDPISMQYLENVTVDYTETLMGGGFKFDSPNITGSCGCGKSVSF